MSRLTSAFDLVYLDVWGPAPFVSKSGHKYYVIFIDDYSRYTYIYFMKHRNKLLCIYKKFCTMVRTQFSTYSKKIYFDFGGEYLSHDFRQFLTEHRILPQLSCPDAYAQN